MKYQQLLNAIGGLDKDWEVVWLKPNRLYDPSSPKLQSPKLKVYRKLLAQGHIFPPIPITKDNEVIDGTHRLLAYKRNGIKLVPVIREIGEGSGRVLKDEVYGEGVFTRPTLDEVPECFICSEKLTYYREGANIGPLPGFPLGLPKPPIYVCQNCKIIINRKNFFVWKPELV